VCGMVGYTCEACPDGEWVWIADVSDLMADVKADDGESEELVKTSNSFQN